MRLAGAPFSGVACLSLALVSIALVSPLEAQEELPSTKAESGLDDRELLGIGWGIDPLDPTRWQLELLLCDVKPGKRYTLATGARFGKYAPDELVGESRAALDGFAPNVRKNYFSLYFGLQGRAPLLPQAWNLYARVAAGGSAYMGQEFREAPPGEPPTDVQRSVGDRLAPGLEVAIGRGWVPVSGDLGLRAEVRLGYEHVPHSDRQRPNSRIVFGFSFPL
jgi:hypothetical protein